MAFRIVTDGEKTTFINDTQNNICVCRNVSKHQYNLYFLRFTNWNNNLNIGNCYDIAKYVLCTGYKFRFSTRWLSSEWFFFKWNGFHKQFIGVDVI